MYQLQYIVEANCVAFLREHPAVAGALLLTGAKLHKRWRPPSSRAQMLLIAASRPSPLIGRDSLNVGHGSCNYVYNIRAKDLAGGASMRCRSTATQAELSLPGPLFGGRPPTVDGGSLIARLAGGQGDHRRD